MKFFNAPEEKVTISATDVPATNIHNRVVRIRPDLCVIGFGGSIPVYKDEEVYWLGELLLAFTAHILCTYLPHL